MQVIAYMIYICAFYRALLHLVYLFCLSLKRAMVGFANDFELLASLNHIYYVSMHLTDLFVLGLLIFPIGKMGKAQIWK